MPKDSSNFGKLYRARRMYMAFLKAAIQGQGGLDPNVGDLPGAVRGTVGGGVATSRTLANRTGDMISKQMFAHPESDFLAYHRRIEPVNEFSHAPMYGF